MTATIEEIRDWLRYNADYNIEISLWGLYGCYSVRTTYLSKAIGIYMGMDLDKHLLQAIDAIKEHRNESKTQQGVGRS